MKTISIYILLLLLSYSCLKDYTKEGDLEISEISITKIKTNYEVQQWDTLTINPNVSQSGTQKTLSYEWDIDFKTVSTEAVLENYICKELGLITCILKVSNEDGAAFHDFTIKVNSVYNEGVFVLSEFDGGSLLTFKSTKDIDKPAYIGVYKKTNPDLPLGKTPKFIELKPNQSMIFGDHPWKDKNGNVNTAYIGAGDPLTVYLLDLNTLKVRNKIDFTAEATPENVISSLGWSITEIESLFLGNGKVYDFNDIINQGDFTPYLETYSRLPVDVKLSNEAAYSLQVYFPRGSNVPFYFGTLKVFLYDEHLDRLFNVYRYWGEGEILKGTFTGMTLVRMVPCDSRQNLLLVMKDEANDLRIIYIRGTTLVSNINAAGTTLTQNSSMATSSLRGMPVLYYSNGNGIYRYNYRTSNFPQAPFLNIDRGSEITHMIIPEPDRNDESKILLYVAARNPASSSKYKGDLYCFEVSQGKEKRLWKEEGVAGKVVDLEYREE